MKLLLKATGTGKIITYARLAYVKDEVTINEAIDTIMLYVPSLSLDCSDRVSDGNIKISGATAPSEKVEIYLKETYHTTITADKNGYYEAVIHVDAFWNIL